VPVILDDLLENNSGGSIRREGVEVGLSTPGSRLISLADSTLRDRNGLGFLLVAGKSGQTCKVAHL
jgi:hypothetical protein